MFNIHLINCFSSFSLGAWCSCNCGDTVSYHRPQGTDLRGIDVGYRYQREKDDKQREGRVEEVEIIRGLVGNRD